ncbi:MAG: hypothetical protein SangKO_067350 [Sandaracinaceae bacterium]
MRLPHCPRALVIVNLLLVLATLGGCESCGCSQPDPDAPPPPYDLGLVPTSVQIEWPAEPETDAELVVRSQQDVLNGYFESNTTLRVVGDLEELVIDADDVVIAPDQGVRIQSVRIVRGRRRLRFQGGSYGSITFEPPHILATDDGGFMAHGMIEDVTFDSITVDDGSPAMAVRGRRVAVLHSYLSSNSMAFFVGDTTPIPSTDIIVADSVLESAGSGSTLVLNQVERSVVVDSWITNPLSFGYVVSGESDQTFARENVLIGGGASIGDWPGSDVGTAWFLANTVFHTSVLFGFDVDQVQQLHLVANAVYSDRVTCAWCPVSVPEDWNVTANVVRPYEAPPTVPARP